MGQAGIIIDEVLHDTLLVGALAAQIFVKNATHQQTAALLINAVAKLLPVLDGQLTGAGPAASNPAAGGAQ